MIELDRVRWIKHKNKDIIIADYSKLRSSMPKEKAIIFQVIEGLKAELKKLNGKKALVLSDVTESFANKETMNGLKQLAKYTSENNLIERECVLGITGINKFLLRVVNLFAKSDLKPFTDMEEALNYLVG